jgi:signal peptidase I
MEKSNTLGQEIKSLALLVLIAMLIRTIIFEPFFIPSSSMEPTLLEGDYIFATKYDYGYSRYSIPFSPNLFGGRILEKTPQAGDVIIFRPPHRMDIRYVKRLIGISGDKIQLINDILYINDKEVPRQYIEEYSDLNGVKYKKYKETLPNGVSYNIINFANAAPQNTQVFIVPKDHYFFMGDNRNNSLDSRYSLRYVHGQNLIAKAKLIFFSTKARLWLEEQNFADRFKQIGVWISSFRFSRMFRSIYQ